jgi:two-component system NtrC family sensor kinase
MANEKILLIFSDLQVMSLLSRSVLSPAGYHVTMCTDWPGAEAQLNQAIPDLVMIEARVGESDGLELAGRVLEKFPYMQAILFGRELTPELLRAALRSGLADCLASPVRAKEVLASVELALRRRKSLQDWARFEVHRDTASLQRQLAELEAVERVGRSVTASLDLDSILTTAVEAAVELTGAEEGSLLLLDPNTQELYVRAARNLGDELVQTLRLKVEDTLAGQVIQSGEPLFLHEKAPRKIKTAYLVHSLIYVPLLRQGQAIGVLGVDNRQQDRPFQREHLTLLATIADYAAIAIENARLFANTAIERRKLDQIMHSVDDAVIVVDPDRRLVFINPSARRAFSLADGYYTGKSAYDVLHNPELLQIFNLKAGNFPCRREITLDDGRTLNAQASAIPEVGLAITMQDITRLKELDRVKSEFVSTVSHDLRSPLTAILGYVELLGRVGPLNEVQRDFIGRVYNSVQNITMLINELLDLGRIEAGFDTQKEALQPADMLTAAIDELKELAQTKQQTIAAEYPPHLPQVFASPTRLRQAFSNLISNAVKYTEPGGRITVRASAETGQVVIQVQDNGPGIPSAEQPYVFNRFYRASNVNDAPGTGLGLAIVKSIIENHNGRVWVESILGEGTTFTVMLPIATAE